MSLKKILLNRICNYNQHQSASIIASRFLFLILFSHEEMKSQQLDY